MQHLYRPPIRKGKENTSISTRKVWASFYCNRSLADSCGQLLVTYGKGGVYMDVGTSSFLKTRASLWYVCCP
jgi:hypothetical protein